jgi:hypothetical protein
MDDIRKLKTYHKGWLEKKGSLIKNWKKRWFVLSFDKLEYFVEEDQKSKKGDIAINATSKILYRDGTVHSYKFGVQTGDRMLEMCSESNEERLDWIGNIQEVIGFHNETSAVDILHSPSLSSYPIEDYDSSNNTQVRNRVQSTNTNRHSQRSRLAASTKRSVSVSGGGENGELISRLEQAIADDSDDEVQDRAMVSPKQRTSTKLQRDNSSSKSVNNNVAESPIQTNTKRNKDNTVSNTNKKTSKASEEAQQEKLSAEVVPIKDFTISDTTTSAAYTTTESTGQASAKNTASTTKNGAPVSAALETTTSTGSKFTESTTTSQSTTAEIATTATHSSTSASSHSNNSNTKVETIQNDISVGKTATVDKKNLWCSDDDDSDSDDDSRMVITNHKPMSGSATSLYEDSDEDAVYIDTTKKQIPNKNNVISKVNTNIPIVHIQPSVADNTTSTNEPTNLEFTIDNLPDIGSLAFPT